MKLHTWHYWRIDPEETRKFCDTFHNFFIHFHNVKTIGRTIWEPTLVKTFTFATRWWMKIAQISQISSVVWRLNASRKLPSSVTGRLYSKTFEFFLLQSTLIDINWKRFQVFTNGGFVIQCSRESTTNDLDKPLTSFNWLKAINFRIKTLEHSKQLCFHYTRFNSVS